VLQFRLLAQTEAPECVVSISDCSPDNAWPLPQAPAWLVAASALRVAPVGRPPQVVVTVVLAAAVVRAGQPPQVAVTGAAVAAVPRASAAKVAASPV